MIGRVARRDLSRYYWAMRREYERWRLRWAISDATWDAIVAYTNQSYWDRDELERVGVSGFSVGLQNYLRSPSGVGHAAEATRAVESVMGLTPAELLAIIDAAEVEWQRARIATPDATSVA